jgi:hypothetical protein
MLTDAEFQRQCGSAPEAEIVLISGHKGRGRAILAPCVPINDPHCIYRSWEWHHEAPPYERDPRHWAPYWTLEELREEFPPDPLTTDELYACG